MRYLIAVVVLSFGLGLSGCDKLEAVRDAQKILNEKNKFMKENENLKDQIKKLEKQIDTQGKRGSDSQKDLEILKSLISHKPEDQVGAM